MQPVAPREKKKLSAEGSLSWWQRHGHLLACLAYLGYVAFYYFDYLSGHGHIWEDLLREYYPSANYFATAVASGRFPLWQPGLMNGIPFYSDIQTGMYYPFAWILVLFVRHGNLPILVFQWYVVLHIAFGGLLMYAFLKHRRLHPLACLLGATIFSFSGFSALHVIHLPMLKVYAWLPLQLLLVDKIVTLRRAKYYAFLTGAIAVSFFAGFPQATLYDSLLLVGYWLYRRHKELAAGPKRSVWSMLGSMFGESLKMTGVFVSVLLLGAVMVLPSMQYWSRSERQKWGYDLMTSQSMPPHYLMQFAVPNYLGVSNGGENDVPFWGYNHDRIQNTIPNAGCWQYWEFGGYASQLALIGLLGALFCHKRLRETPTLFLLGAILFGLWFMFGRFGGLFKVLYYTVPGVALFRGPARMSGVVDICLALIAAFWVNALLEKDPPRLAKPLFVLFSMYALASGMYCLWVYGMGAAFGKTIEAAYAQKEVLFSIVMFGGTALCLAGLRSRVYPILQRTAMVGLVAFVWVDLANAYQFFHQGEVNPQTYYNTNAGLIGTYTNLVNQVGPIRMAQGVDPRFREILVEPNIPLVHHELEMSQGYVDFLPVHKVDLEQVTNQTAVLDLENIGLIVGANLAMGQGSIECRPHCLPRVGFYSSVKRYPTDKAILEDIESGRLNYHETVAVRADKLGDALPPAPVTVQPRMQPLMISMETPECYRIHYNIDQPGIIFVSENYYRGWEAEDSDGQPLMIVRAFNAFKGIVIPHAGSGVVTVQFRPYVFRLGWQITGATVLLLAVLYGWLMWRERRPPTTPPSRPAMPADVEEFVEEEEEVEALESIVHARI